MHQLGLLVCATGPSVILLLYGIAKGRIRLTSHPIWTAFVAGGMTALFIASLEIWLKHILQVEILPAAQGAATRAVLVAALPEEAMKLTATFVLLKRCGPSDIAAPITIAFAVALGFAAVENLAYLVAAGDWPLVASGRAALAVPVHGIDGLAMGSLLTMARLRPRQRLLWLGAALALPMMLHAVYDFPLMLVAKRQNFIGVLPAWFLTLLLSTACVLYICNKISALVQRNDNTLNRMPRAPIPRGLYLLLIPTILAIAFVDSVNFGILAAILFTAVPTILTVDLIWTSRSASGLPRYAAGHSSTI